VTRAQAPIPFNRPFRTGREHLHIAEAMAAAHLSADGEFSRRARAWLERRTGAAAALLVHSATGALELAMLVAGIGPGDEVVMPSYTFVSTANAVVLRGATPVFVDVRPDTLNLDESLVEDAITPATKAIVPVHYAGVACAMDALLAIAARNDVALVEDAAQGIMASAAGRPLGTFGALGALSFHETKNVTCGEGGALLVNDPARLRAAEIAREKGTNRMDLLCGLTDHYTWLEPGSSFALSDLAAAFLWAQLESADDTTARRLAVWDGYDAALADLERAGVLRRPIVPAGVRHNAHMYYVLVESRAIRDRVIEDLRRGGIQALFHYVPLHDSPGGLRYGRAHGDLPVTTSVAGRLLRLPLWVGMTDEHILRVAGALARSLHSARRREAARLSVGAARPTAGAGRSRAPVAADGANGRAPAGAAPASAGDAGRTRRTS
jgi:dTDP-4-amino-4,6-dideoxygalactose transaminase